MTFFLNPRIIRVHPTNNDPFLHAGGLMFLTARFTAKIVIAIQSLAIREPFYVTYLISPRRMVVSGRWLFLWP